MKTKTPRRRQKARPLRRNTLRPAILVVDDDRAVLRATKELLAAAGYRVFVADDGRKALRVLARMPIPAIIVLDTSLKYVSGQMLMHLLWEDPTYLEVPVIVISGTDDRIRGAAEHLQKPVDSKKLLALVRRHAAARP